MNNTFLSKTFYSVMLGRVVVVECLPMHQEIEYRFNYKSFRIFGVILRVVRPVQCRRGVLAHFHYWQRTVCYFVSFGIFLASKESNYSERMLLF